MGHVYMPVDHSKVLLFFKKSAINTGTGFRLITVNIMERGWKQRTESDFLFSGNNKCSVAMLFFVKREDFFQRTAFVLLILQDGQCRMKMSLLDHSNPTLLQIVRYTDLSLEDSTTIDRDIAGLFEDVQQSRHSSTEAFATLHAFTNRASEQLP